MKKINFTSKINYSFLLVFILISYTVALASLITSYYQLVDNKKEYYEEKEETIVEPIVVSNDTTIILTVKKSTDGMYHLYTPYLEAVSMTNAQLDSMLVDLGSPMTSEPGIVERYLK